MTVISFAMVWDAWIAYVGGGKLERRDKLLISHIDGVAHGRKMKSQHPEKVSHTHTHKMRQQTCESSMIWHL